MLEEIITPNPDEDTSQNTENEKRDLKKESLDFIKDL
jgi:hypothetical protein